MSKIEALLATGDPVLGGDIVMFQEVARGKPGWTKTQEIGKCLLIRCQGETSWRGIGVAIDKDKFSVIKRKACEHALWVQVGDQGSSQRVWLGTMYLSTRVPMVEYTVQRRRLMAELPATGDAVILGGHQCCAGMDEVRGWRIGALGIVCKVEKLEGGIGHKEGGPVGADRSRRKNAH